MERTQDLRIRCIEMLKTPAEMEKELPISQELASRISGYRESVSDIIHGKYERLRAVFDT